MEKKRFRVGSIAVLFAVVILCVAVFAALTVVTSAQDLRISQRYAQHIQDFFDCESLGYEWLAQVDKAAQEGKPLPEGSWQEQDVIGVSLETSAMRLNIRLKMTENGHEIQQWSCSTKWQPQNSWELWH